jgi:hypothetical protein
MWEHMLASHQTCSNICKVYQAHLEWLPCISWIVHSPVPCHAFSPIFSVVLWWGGVHAKEWPGFLKRSTAELYWNHMRWSVDRMGCCLITNAHSKNIMGIKHPLLVSLWKWECCPWDMDSILTLLANLLTCSFSFSFSFSASSPHYSALPSSPLSHYTSCLPFIQLVLLPN